MQIEEFKAWFEGICENIESTPSAAQFTKIKAKIATIEAKPLAKVTRGVDPWAPAPAFLTGERFSDLHVEASPE